MKRALFKRCGKLWRKLPRWGQALSVVAALIACLNLTVSFLGRSHIFFLSPFYLTQKLSALGAFAKHAPACLRQGHPAAMPYIKQAERVHRLPPGLLQSVVQVESESAPHRISSAGAMGLLQLMPDTADWLGVKDPFNTEQSIDAGARYLSVQLKRTKDIRLAVAAYNAGPGNVERTVPRNGETEFYVAKVLRAYDRNRPSKSLEKPPRPQPPKGLSLKR